MSFPVIKQLVMAQGELMALDQFGQVWVRVLKNQIPWSERKDIDYHWVLRKSEFNAQSLREWSAATGEKVE